MQFDMILRGGTVAPVGIDLVLVNGQVALSDGQPGILAGRVLKGL